MSDSPPRAVLVIGPGRAGTSTTMRALNLLGVDVGPEDGLVEPGAGGPKGFWERRRIIELNERLLRSQGGTWRRPPRFQPGWESAEELEPEREEARAILREDFGDSRLWGWKDPRASLTLPFWQPLLAELGCEARYVICVRNPLDCATSISPRPEQKDFFFSRHGPPLARAFPLWVAYVASALANTAGRSRTLVAYEDWFERRAGTAARLARFVGREPPEPGGEAERQIEDFVEDGLWHHRTSAADVLRDGQVPADACGLYVAVEALREEASKAPADAGSGLAMAELADLYAGRLLAERERSSRGSAPRA